MTNLVDIQALEKRYDGFALGPLSMAVAPGEVVGFVGANGAGKTTTLRIMLGCVRATAGEVHLFGQQVATTGVPAAVRESVGVVFDTMPFPDMRLKDVAATGRAAYSAWNDARFSALCKQFGLEGRKNVRELSRGMGMKLQLAFALAHRPQLLVLDEPTAGLDPLARDEVLDLLRTYMEDDTFGPRSILISTHITTDLDKLADRVVCINAGRIAFDLPKDDICDCMGVARLRLADYERAFAAGHVSAGTERATYVEALIKNRRAFAAQFPELACTPATIEDYMALTLKGEQ